MAEQTVERLEDLPGGLLHTMLWMCEHGASKTRSVSVVELHRLSLETRGLIVTFVDNTSAYSERGAALVRDYQYRQSHPVYTLPLADTATEASAEHQQQPAAPVNESAAAPKPQTMTDTEFFNGLCKVLNINQYDNDEHDVLRLVEAAQVEVKRLREALETIERNAPHFEPELYAVNLYPQAHAFWVAGNIAREVLNQK